MLKVYRTTKIPQDYQMTIYKHTTNGFLNLKYLIIPSSKKSEEEVNYLIGDFGKVDKVVKIPFKDDLNAFLVYL